MTRGDRSPFGRLHRFFSVLSMIIGVTSYHDHATIIRVVHLNDLLIFSNLLQLSAVHHSRNPTFYCKLHTKQKPNLPEFTSHHANTFQRLLHLVQTTPKTEPKDEDEARNKKSQTV